MTAIDARVPENWLVQGAALETRRRRTGADVQRGFEYQRAFAVWKIAELLDDTKGIVGVRYEGAQDVDLLLADGRVIFVQLKDTPDDIYPASQIAPILIGFALDLLDSGEDERASFELIVPIAPGAPALQRLADRRTIPADREAYLRALRQVPQLAALDPARLDRLLDTVLGRITVHRARGRLGERFGIPIFSVFAEQALRAGGVADDHVAGLLAQIETSLKGRPVTTVEEMRASAYAARRLPHRASMAPPLPSHFQPRPMLIEQLRDQLLAENRLAIIGLGGSGKTMLSQALAVEPDITAKYPDGVLWISLGQAPNIIAHLQTLLRVLNRRVDGAGDESALRGELNAALIGRTFLLILDDLWDMAIGASFTLPEGCGLVVTSRQPRVASSLGMAGVEVGALRHEEAMALLDRILGPIAELDRASAERFIERVARLAFAVRLGALLVADGRTFDRLVEDLSAEERRLSALDIDQGDAPAPEDRRREKSLEACLALSVATLGPELRTCFFQLAVVPDDVEIDPELGSAIFALDDTLAARDRLFDLSARGLASLRGPAYSATFRIHDLVRDYARTAFGPRRPLVVAVPASLPETLPALHGDLIDRSLASSPSGLWANFWPDFYFDDHLGTHLIAAGRTGDLAQVLRETAHGQATWLTRQRRHQNTSGFLRFVQNCIGHGISALLDQPADTAPAPLADMMTAAIAGASTAGRAANIPAGLLGAMVRAGEQSFDDALAQASLCDYAQRAHHLLDLLPLASSTARQTILGSLTAELIRTPFPLMGDRIILDGLLPQLSEQEIAGLETAARSSPEVESEFLWALARNMPSDRSDRIGEIISYCQRSNDPPVRDTLLLLAADSLGGFEATPDLISSALASRRHHVKFAAFLSLPSDELARQITSISVANCVLEQWEQHPSRISEVATEAIWRTIDDLQPDGAALGAWTSARLMAVTGRADPARISRCETAFAAMDDSNWRKADGYGWLVQAASVEARPHLARLFTEATAKRDFRDFGVKRFRQIAKTLPQESFEPLAKICDAAQSDRRAMVLAGLLEQAPEALWGTLTLEIFREAERSGKTGDIFAVADRIPGQLLRGIWQAVDGVRPSPELVHAAAALSENLHSDLTSWFAASWTRLRSDERIRAAAGHSAIAALYPDKQALLTDIARAAGISNTDGEWFPLGALDDADARRLISDCSAEDFSRFVADNPGLLALVADYDIAKLLDWFGEGLSRSEVEALWVRVRTMTSDRRATILGRIGQLLGDRSAIAEAVTLLLESGSPTSAAIWFARYGQLTSVEDRARLHTLRAPDMATEEAVMLEIALYPYLDGGTQAQIEQRFAQRRGLFPGFVAGLDRSNYPLTMTRIFDQCLNDFAQARLGSGPGKNSLRGAKQLLDLPAECLPLLYAPIIPDPTLAMRYFAIILATAGGLNVEKLCKAITRAAPLIAGSLSQGERDILTANMVASARAHAR
jgi:hypothetical protein